MIVLLQLLSNQDRIIIDFGNGNNRKASFLRNIEIEEDLKVLIGFPSFSGNDFISSFFGKGKQLCWKTMEKDSSYIEAFQPLGNSWDVTTETMDTLEDYVCLLHGEKNTNVNNARFEIFHKKHVNQSKVVNISLLPPCKYVLKLHCFRSNYIAKMWKACFLSEIELPEHTRNGWNNNFNVLSGMTNRSQENFLRS